MKQFPNNVSKEFYYSKGRHVDDLSHNGNIIARILKRRVSMEYMNESDDDAEDENGSFL